MHSIEPYYSWRHLYIASEDKRSPFYRREYSEFEFSNAVYNYYIHPQWDEIGSSTLYAKLLFVDYEKGYCVIEFIGEWNDLLHNDVMELKKNLIDVLTINDIHKFILLGEHVMNMHSDENDYYQEWFDEIEDGWIVGLNFRDHVIKEFENARIDYYISFGGKFDEFNWKVYRPDQLFEQIDKLMMKRLNP
ncbi:MAG: hypothetical protein CVU00_14715 [Bacteroidetes bacterium HGW-Bacteroidetes-17]|jgi:hypothetical protein|nr:MAG: hypothetical protein CVU00_14715 [Bacteroidetes bacterium HGW-Bacteroidetes-17]